MDEHPKVSFVERPHRPVEKEHVLKDAAAEGYRVLSGTRANDPARLGDHLYERIVESSGNYAYWYVVAKVFDNGTD
jgi:hypothetical protein